MASKSDGGELMFEFPDSCVGRIVKCLVEILMIRISG